ncbi:MAG TPA: universal stress protein [Kofleriaceae bacterium]|nr:universal stress protein [Kofleriaceae bacterium]
MSHTDSNVVVGYDFSPSGDAALHRAITLATRAPCHTLYFACIVDPRLPAIVYHGYVDYAYTERLEQALADIVMQELRDAHIANRVQFCVHVRIGNPSDELLRLTRDLGADLLIVGSNSQPGDPLILGPVAEHVVRNASCSVEIARPTLHADVELPTVTDAEPPLEYFPPHRYSYEDRRLTLRPIEWPAS